MNKRIKKFAEHAGFCMWDDEEWNPGDIIDWSCSYDKELEKFAELIARTCIAKCIDLNSMKYISDHFGIQIEGLNNE